ncbi:hypothetical protein BDV93DRAFT_493461 [Ceratobasidium sp. AG-I]|nr:hypothetical protein BDV93DRAFT_493461 [Ceratobasidium sp. AG-I]
MPQPSPLTINKRASRLSFSAHPVSPVVATANIPNSYSEDDITLAQPPESLYVNPGVRLSFGIIGLSALMPWNAMITAMPYFLARLSGSSFSSSFPSWLSVIWTSTSFLSLAYATWTAGNVIPAIRVVLPLACNTLLVILLALTPYLQFSPGSFFASVLVDGALQAALGSYLQTSVVALASAFGPDAIAAYMTGGALVAVGVSLLKLFTVYTRPVPLNNDELPPSLFQTLLEQHGGSAARGATSYFYIAAAFISSGIAAYAYLYGKIPHDTFKEDTPELDQESVTETEPSEVDYLLGRVSNTPVPMSGASIWIVARKNAYYNFAVFYVFVVTLAMFPAITTSIQPLNSPLRSPIFDPLVFSALHFLNFNLADLLGRTFVAIPSLSPSSTESLLTYSLARTLFIPLLLLCNVQHHPKFSSHLPSPEHPFPSPIINSDVTYMLILFAFGLTNGHASTLVLMAAPSKVLNPRLELYESKTAARIAQFCLVGGLVVGSAASFGLRAIQCRCNPFVDA